MNRCVTEDCSLFNPNPSPPDGVRFVFKGLVIEDERYLRACGLYVEGNPVEAGMVNRCEDWPHSSSRYYFTGLKDDLVDHYEMVGEIPRIEGNKESYFTKGTVIGSDLFKIYKEENAFQWTPVP